MVEPQHAHKISFSLKICLQYGCINILKSKNMGYIIFCKFEVRGLVDLELVYFLLANLFRKFSWTTSPMVLSTCFHVGCNIRIYLYLLEFRFYKI